MRYYTLYSRLTDFFSNAWTFEIIGLDYRPGPGPKYRINDVLLFTILKYFYLSLECLWIYIRLLTKANFYRNNAKSPIVTKKLHNSAP